MRFKPTNLTLKYDLSQVLTQVGSSRLSSPASLNCDARISGDERDYSLGPKGGRESHDGRSEGGGGIGWPNLDWLMRTYTGFG